MIRYKFREEESSIGKTLRPVAEVILERDDFEVETLMYIDSGADVSMIPFGFGKALGFEQKEDDVIHEVRGVSGGSVPYILRGVTLVLNGKRLEIKLAWALVEEVPLVMGRKDIFDKFQITFDETSGWIKFREVSEEGNG